MSTEILRNESHHSPGWARLASDPLLLVAGTLWGVVALAIGLNELGIEVPALAQIDRSTWLFILMSGIAFEHARRRARAPGGHRFWLLLELAFGLWLINETLVQLWPDSTNLTAVGWWIDGLYLLVYLLTILAIEERPHRPPEWSSAVGARRAVRRAGDLVFCFGLLVYFVWIPSAIDLEAYQSWLPSLSMYLVLDLALAGRFAQLALSVKHSAWSYRYALFAVAFVGWASMDAMDAIAFGSDLKIDPHTVLDLPWYVGFLCIMIAARSTRTETGAERPAVSPEPLPRVDHTATSLVFYSLALALLHYLGYRLGILNDASRPAREVAIILMMVAFGVLAYLATGLGKAMAKLEVRAERSRRLEALGQLAGGVAHDFNNLLTVINGYCSLALRQQDATTLRSDLLEIHNAGHRAASLTHQLMAFGRGQRLELEILSANELVESMEAMLSRVLGDDVVLDVDTEPETLFIAADRALIEQALMNIAINARQAMPQGGRLSLSLTAGSFGPRDHGRPDNLAAGPYVRLRISDTGGGIDPADLPYVFDPFFTRRGDEGGSGLGLTTAYTAVARCGGQIVVDSELGRGSSFDIYLPRDAGEPERKPRDERAIGPPSEGLVLVVEDEDQIRSLVDRILTAEGFRVVVAPGAEAALEILSGLEAELALLITDVVMPETSGPELVERVRAQSPEVRVIYISGFAPETSLHFNQVDSSIPLLTKPFEGDDLLSVVRSTLGPGDTDEGETTPSDPRTAALPGLEAPRRGRPAAGPRAEPRPSK